MTNISLRNAFNLAPTGELIAIVGGGGKTSLMVALANELAGRVVITTTTRIFAAQMKLFPAVLEVQNWVAERETLLARLQAKLDEQGQCLLVGAIEGEKALGVPPALADWLVAQAGVDYVLVEADGSRMRPFKAPADHEPVIPAQTTLVVPVVGIDALQRPLTEVTHRPEKVAAILASQGVTMGEWLTPTDVAAVLSHPQGGLKGVPAGARVIPLINKVATPDELAAGRQIAHALLRSATPFKRVVLSALKEERPIREVHSPVTAVVLAGGESKRMGRNKLLLAWGATTVLGQTIRHAKASLSHEIVVVTGHEAEKTAAIAQAEGVATCHNPAYQTGEMLSSLQAAVRELAEGVTAVLVILGDQPTVRPDTLDQLLIAYWQGQGDIIAPTYEGRRGNPVLIGRRHFADLLALPNGAAPRDLLRQHPVQLIPVNDPGIHQDLDTPEGYTGMLG